MEDNKTFVFRFQFSPDDERLAYDEPNRRIRRNAILMIAVYLLLLGIFGFAIYVRPFPYNSIFDYLIAGILLVVGFRGLLVSLDSLLYGGHKTAQFDAFEAEAAFEDEWVINRTPYVEQRVSWEAVKRISVRPYGIVVQTIVPRWFIPLSAFPSPVEMHKSYKQLKLLHESKKKAV